MASHLLVKNLEIQPLLCHNKEEMVSVDLFKNLETELLWSPLATQVVHFHIEGAISPWLMGKPADGAVELRMRCIVLGNGDTNKYWHVLRLNCAKVQ